MNGNGLDRVVEVKEKRLRKLVSFLAVLCSITLILVLVIVVYDNRKILRIENSSKVQRDRISDCTTPGGDCYEASVREQGKAIATINQVTIIAVFCGNEVDANGHLKNDSIPKMIECVQEGLRQFPPR